MASIPSSSYSHENYELAKTTTAKALRYHKIPRENREFPEWPLLNEKRQIHILTKLIHLIEDVLPSILFLATSASKGVTFSHRNFYSLSRTITVLPQGNVLVHTGEVIRKQPHVIVKIVIDLFNGTKHEVPIYLMDHPELCAKNEVEAYEKCSPSCLFPTPICTEIIKISSKPFSGMRGHIKLKCFELTGRECFQSYFADLSLPNQRTFKIKIIGDLISSVLTLHSKNIFHLNLSDVAYSVNIDEKESGITDLSLSVDIDKSLPEVLMFSEHHLRPPEFVKRFGFNNISRDDLRAMALEFEVSIRDLLSAYDVWGLGLLMYQITFGFQHPLYGNNAEESKSTILAELDKLDKGSISRSDFVRLPDYLIRQNPLVNIIHTIISFDIKNRMTIDDIAGLYAPFVHRAARDEEFQMYLTPKNNLEESYSAFGYGW